MIKRWAAVLLVAFLVLAGAGCAGSSEGPEEMILGGWHFDLGLSFFKFRENGTYAYDMDWDRIDSGPKESGTYTVEDGVLVMVSGEASQWCEPGDEARYEVSFTDNDHATWVPVSGECWRTRDGLMQAESLPFTRMEAD